MIEGEKTQNCRQPELIGFCAQGAAFQPLKFQSWYPNLVNKLSRRSFFFLKISKINADTMEKYREMNILFNLEGIHQ